MLNNCETENANANAYSPISITIYKNQSKRRSYQAISYIKKKKKRVKGGDSDHIIDAKTKDRGAA